MKILFIEVRGRAPYVSIGILSSILKKYGHKCEAIYTNDYQKMKDKILQSSPDLIAFSCDSHHKTLILRRAQQIKEEFHHIQIMLGGLHPSICPEIIHEKGVDIICRGEGEETIVELANALEQGKDIIRIKNLWVKRNNHVYKNLVRPLIQNLDKLPFPDTLVMCPSLEYPFKVHASRGCYNNCHYCFNHIMKRIYANKGKYVRIRSVKNVIQELKTAIKKEQIRSVVFSDDSLIMNKDWFFKFCSKYKTEVNLPFTCNITVDRIDEEIFVQLEKAHCVGIRVGMETGDEKFRKEVLNKKITNKQLLKTAELAKKYKISLWIWLMYGYYNEKCEDIINVIKLLVKMGVKETSFVKLKVFPKYDLERYYSEKNIRIDENTFYLADDDPKIQNIVMLAPLLIKFPALINLLKFINYRVPFPGLFIIISTQVRYFNINKFFRFSINQLSIYKKYSPITRIFLLMRSRGRKPFPF